VNEAKKKDDAKVPELSVVDNRMIDDAQRLGVFLQAPRRALAPLSGRHT